MRAPIKHLVLPAVTLATGLITTLTRLIRSSMLEVIREDYVTTARAKGVREIAILFRHVLRNALHPGYHCPGAQHCLAARRRSDHRAGVCVARHGPA